MFSLLEQRRNFTQNLYKISSTLYVLKLVPREMQTFQKWHKMWINGNKVLPCQRSTHVQSVIDIYTIDIYTEFV